MLLFSHLSRILLYPFLSLQLGCQKKGGLGGGFWAANESSGQQHLTGWAAGCVIDGKLWDCESRPSFPTEAPCSPASLSILFLFGPEDYSEESSKASSEGIIEEQQED